MIDLLQMCNHSPIPSTPTPPPPRSMLLIMYLVGICIHYYGQKCFVFSNTTIISFSMAALRHAWVIPFPPLHM